MANNLNTVTVVGNVTRDPELRYTQGGQPRCNVGVAVNRSWMNRQTNDWEERTSFFNVVVWGDMAENVGHSITKGTRVVVTGRIEQRSWETDQGEKRSVVEIVADEFAPSLRFATAEVSRIERRGPDDGGSRAPRQAAAPAPAAAAPAAAPASTSYDEYSEEPF